MKAVILAGGFGKRLKPLTDDTPKPMLKVAGRPILEWQMESLRDAQVDQFVLCIGNLKEIIIGHFGDGSAFGVRVDHVIEQEPLGTGGALHNALRHVPVSEPFFCLNGDVLTDLDVNVLREKRASSGAVGGLSLVPLPSPYGTVVTDGSGAVRDFLEKPKLRDHWINAGLYCLDPSVADYLPQRGSLELDVFPILAERGLLTAVKYPDSYWASIDSPKDLEDADKVFADRAK